MLLFNIFHNIFRKQEGQALAEYSLILVLIAILCLIALSLLGIQAVNVLNQIAVAL
jgi:Flp pilus assembly pilin Flp